MTREVCITTGARLHFGLLSYEPSSGRHFGGAGLMIDSPGFQLAIRDSVQSGSGGRFESRLRAEDFAVQYLKGSAREQNPGCWIDVLEEIPAHRGLGSGTQLGMAVATGLAVLAGDSEADAVWLARRVGRGARSALGIHGFAQGGFLVDAGKTDSDSIGSVVAREEFPVEWRIVLVTPAAEYGLSGEGEEKAFARLAPMPLSRTDRLCRLVLMDLLPAVIEADFERFSEAAYEFGHAVGEYFDPVQGGLYSSVTMRRLVAELRSAGVRGVGQTSWGPTIFVVMPSQIAAEDMLRDLSADTRWSNCQFQITSPLNSGALIQTS